ncbi:hypothetical protein GALL_359520 [mine drainage metagenome]|uniref:Uncharacterized protein n=1 Tax=mine drainage metagenome TaxID=410659 RepID=A0A1J5QFF0_9ZZZZ
MKFQFRLGLIALASAVSLPALATSGFTPVPGEVGFVVHAPTPVKTRAEVLKELEDWKRNPVSAGWRQVDNDVGWVFVGTTSSKPRAAVQ